MSDAELEREIRLIRPSRNFSRLSVQLLEVTLDRITGVISASLDGFQEHVPEPEPNPGRFIGYVRYNKEDYVKRYEELKPLRDLSRLLRTFLPNMRVIRDGLQRRYGQLVEQREVRQLRRRIQEQLIANDGQDRNGMPMHADDGLDDDGIPLLEDVDPLD